ncbi:MAG: bifunctional DNA-formamidopyrimidine glycosylase/DNA-(apurinic or apyrimidinic site) lyase [Gammaproteobacteria bacterium]|nr:bifunctional DNA-formamidopyrimidine glycosylase/DNA-(apurinic or apyrimidinic site) lyase [Gammaproteobacteria bacterium]
MPELPEVEITRRGIEPVLRGQRIKQLAVRSRKLRWPIPRGLEQRLHGATVAAVDRRAKYLLLRTDQGTALIHLGMTGGLRLVADRKAPNKHDHYDIVLENGSIVRFNDTRRFGSLLWAGDRPERHRLLRDLGPEPLGPGFTGDYLRRVSRGRRVAIKQLLMNAHIVVGVGNIYASEALFRAGINPKRAAGRISLPRMERLTDTVREVLRDSLRSGGTTLRDFYGGDGRPGYFVRELRVYDRADLPCLVCSEPIRHIVQGQRSTYYCKGCQT